MVLRTGRARLAWGRLVDVAGDGAEVGAGDGAVVDAAPASTVGVVVHLGDEEAAVGVDALDVGDVAEPAGVEDHERACDGHVSLGPDAVGVGEPGPGVAAPGDVTAAGRVVGALSVREGVGAVVGRDRGEAAGGAGEEEA